jgi:hypothetical protein
MLSRTGRFAGVAAAVLAVTAGLPAGAAGAADGPCRAVVSQSTGSEVAILLEGHFSSSRRNAPDVTLTCHIVQNGVKVVSVTDPFSGAFAALASDERIGTDPFYVCYTLTDVPTLGPLPEEDYTSTDC